MFNLIQIILVKPGLEQFTLLINCFADVVIRQKTNTATMNG